jgi:hypothetical protein
LGYKRVVTLTPLLLTLSLYAQEANTTVVKIVVPKNISKVAVPPKVQVVVPTPIKATTELPKIPKAKKSKY